MTCECGSERILSVYGKTSDLCVINYGVHEHDGYVPEGLGIGGGDDLELEICVECGRVQGFTPLTDEEIHAAMDVEDELEPEED